MKSGVEYLHSRQKARLDQTVAALLTPAHLAAQIGAKATFGLEIYEDKRLGQNGELVPIPKIKTLNEAGEPISDLADSYRQKGLDELAQLSLVKSGVMSIVGTRHLLPEEDETMRRIAQRTCRGRELLARHDDIVLPAKRGLISTFAVQAHVQGNQTVERRLAMNVDDHLNASIKNDLGIILRVAKSAALNELANGTNHIS